MKKYASVAVVTRTKDRAVLLERAIQSIHNQTYNDLIHVIINDGGDTYAVDKLVAKHSKLIGDRVIVIHNKQSSGMEAASNKAIKSVDSTYIAIHDDDDSWSPLFLEKAVERLEADNAMGVVVTTDIVEEQIDGKKIIKLKQGRSEDPPLGMISLYDQCNKNFATPITFLYRRSVYEKVGYYNEDLAVAGDWEFAIRFLMEYDIVTITTDQALAYYHHRNSAQGVELNSIYVDGGIRHEYNIKKIANNLLRNELKIGKLGLGYIISSMRARDAEAHNELVLLNERLNESVKVELHGVSDGIKEYTKLQLEEALEKIKVDSVDRRLVRKVRNGIGR